jgi:hypothetical protein
MCNVYIQQYRLIGLSGARETCCKRSLRGGKYVYMYAQWPISYFALRASRTH